MKTKPKTLVAIICLMAFLVLQANIVPAIAFTVSENKTIASVSTDVEIKQKALTFLNDVAGINMNTYNITSYNAALFQVAGSLKQQTSISIILSNSQKSLGIAMILMEGKVKFYDVSVLSGTLDDKTISPSDSLSIAKTAISNYKNNFNASHCKGFDEAVPTTIQTRNVTINTSDVTISINSFDKSASGSQGLILNWYKNGGLNISAQSIQATFSKSGIMTSFADNLGLYKVATTNIGISKEQAISVSATYIDTFAKENNKKIQAVNTSFQYMIDLNGSRGDSFMIYPIWSVSATFDNSNKELGGYSVLIWADNGQVYKEGPQGGLLNPATNSSLDNMSTGITTTVTIASIIIILTLARMRTHNKGWKPKNLIKLSGVSIVTGALLCMLIIQPVTAYPSSVYTSTHDLDTDYTPYDTMYASYLADMIAGMSESQGQHTAYNWYGSGTTSSNIYIGAYGHYQPYSLSFYYGHGGHNGDTYVIVDNDGGFIYDDNIYYYSGLGGNRHKFVYINACEQGNELDQMPRAWLHDDSISSNGYSSTDDSLQTFIGWSGYSP